MSDVQSNSRRDFLKKSAYVVPVIMTLSATPALAGQGSPHKDYDKDYDRKKRKKKDDKYSKKKDDRKSRKH